jgi:uncharacterized integral membrane protein (TIGR00697 family)
MKHYRFLDSITTVYVAFQLISDVTASKMVTIFDVPVSVTVLYFPITYIFSDILTEVYGYAQARRVVWHAVLASVLAAGIYQFVLALPATNTVSDNAYQHVLGQVPRVLIGGWIAVWAGGMLNDYILAKMKILTNGKFLWLRTTTSTLVGEFTNTALFYSIALAGILPNHFLLQAILVGTAMKVAVEIVFTPWTCWVIAKLKMLEEEDFYDRTTNFNPFIFRNSR